MKLTAPLLTLLPLAVALLAWGGLAAQQVHRVRVPRDAAPQQALMMAMQQEVNRLEQVYEQHLTELGEQLSKTWQDSTTKGQLAQRVEGIRCVTWLHWRAANLESSLHLESPEDASPEPTLTTEHEGLPRPRVLLDSAMIFPDASEQSERWIDKADEALLFSVQRQSTAVIFSIDRGAVERAMTQHFRAWLKRGFEAVKAQGGPDSVRDAAGVVLAEIGAADGVPDRVLSVLSRFGTWTMESADGWREEVRYDGSRLIPAALLASVVVLLGVGLHVQQLRAARLAEQRVSFVNRVSHELRTPMTNILLNLDLVEEDAGGRLCLVKEEAGRLSRLIENVLTFSRGEQGKLSLNTRPCSLVEIVQREARSFEPALTRRGISLTLRHEGSCCERNVDADALAQILANLLSNVEKYAPNGPASISIEQDERGFTLLVQDSGPGISDADAGRIFEPFERVDDRVNSGVSGAGLGLSIARDLARRMGGDLCLVKVPLGACFQLTLS